MDRITSNNPPGRTDRPDYSRSNSQSTSGASHTSPRTSPVSRLPWKAAPTLAGGAAKLRKPSFVSTDAGQALITIGQAFVAKLETNFSNDFLSAFSGNWEPNASKDLKEKIEDQVGKATNINRENFALCLPDLLTEVTDSCATTVATEVNNKREALKSLSNKTQAEKRQRLLSFARSKLIDSLATSVINKYQARPSAAKAAHTDQFSTPRGRCDKAISDSKKQLASLSAALEKPELTVTDVISAIEPTREIKTKVAGLRTALQNQLIHQQGARRTTAKLASPSVFWALRPEDNALAIQHAQSQIKLTNDENADVDALQTELSKLTETVYEKYFQLKEDLSDFDPVMDRIDLLLQEQQWQDADNECVKWEEFPEHESTVCALNDKHDLPSHLTATSSRSLSPYPNILDTSFPGIGDESMYLDVNSLIHTLPTETETRRADNGATPRNLKLLRALVRSDERRTNLQQAKGSLRQSGVSAMALHETGKSAHTKAIEFAGALHSMAAEATADLDDALDQSGNMQLHEKLRSRIEEDLAAWKSEKDTLEAKLFTALTDAQQHEIASVYTTIASLTKDGAYSDIVKLTSGWINRIKDVHPKPSDIKDFEEKMNTARANARVQLFVKELADFRTLYENVGLHQLGKILDAASTLKKRGDALWGDKGTQKPAHVTAQLEIVDKLVATATATSDLLRTLEEMNRSAK